MTRIVIDPGHGGRDPGAMAGDVREADLNLAIAKRLSQALINKGHKLLLLRDDDRFLSLSERTSQAYAFAADLYVSVHCNASGNRSPEPSGFSVHHYIGSDEGRDLARLICDSLAKALPQRTNRGVREDSFYVLRKTAMPAVLVECEFMTNPRGLEFLISESGQVSIAEAIAAGLENYINPQFKGEKNMSESTTDNVSDSVVAAQAATDTDLSRGLKNVARVLKAVGEETEDALEAFCNAVFEGEGAREKSLTLGGSPVPERLAFELGLMSGPLLKFALTRLVKNVLRQLIRVV